MNNLDKYAQVFIDNFGVERAVLSETFTYQCIPAWDSVGHMALVAELEGAFDLMLDTDEILGLSSVGKAVELLRKHGVSLAA
jgi:acyl carrier protein